MKIKVTSLLMALTAFVLTMLGFIVPLPNMQQPAQAQSYGNIIAGSTIDIKFTTRISDGTPTTFAGSPTISCYKDNSTTESTTGITLSTDFDSRTGLNNLRVDTSSDTTFYSLNANIQCIVTSGTVGGTSVVGEVVGSFHIGSAFTFQKGVAFTNFPVWMLTTGGVGLTGLSPTCRIQKDASAWATTTNAPVEVTGGSRGKYNLSLTAAETSAHSFSIECTASGAAIYRNNVTTQQ